MGKDPWRHASGDAFADRAPAAGFILKVPEIDDSGHRHAGYRLMAPGPIDKRKGVAADELRAALPDLSREGFDAALHRMSWYHHAQTARVDLRNGGAREFVLRILDHVAGAST